ncbi:thioesterase family protein [Halanaerobaculum tunisiense]
MLKEGLRYQQETMVEKEDTADQIGSGDLPVYGTPAMIAFIENTAVKAIEAKLEDKQTTVGAKLNINHLHPTPVGETVTCSVKLTEVNDSQLKFDVIVEDENNKIGNGKHVRYIVAEDKFMGRIQD